MMDLFEPNGNGCILSALLVAVSQVVPCDFIGFCESQYPICENGLPVSNHDELMSNFFAQPDALANGKSAEECRSEGRIRASRRTDLLGTFLFLTLLLLLRSWGAGRCKVEKKCHNRATHF